MKIIVGLGNPRHVFENTRHNLGFQFVNHLAKVWRFYESGHSGSRCGNGFTEWLKCHRCYISTGYVNSTSVCLVKPRTLMNLSGYTLKSFIDPSFKLEDILIVVDDIAIPIGTYRLKAKGSSGGHNGLKSIESSLGSQEYARLRIGLKPINNEIPSVSDFVMGEVTKEERVQIEALYPKLTSLVETWITDGIITALNKQ